MTTAKHTPGPWSFAPAVPGAQRCFYISGNHDANNREVDIGTVQGGYYSCEANARLIAAAPDLLEALKVFSELCIHWTEERQLPDNTGLLVVTSPSHLVLGADFTVHDLRRIRAAIAKAEGEV